MALFANPDTNGNPITSDVLAYAPKPVTVAGAGDVVIKQTAGIVAMVHCATPGLGVSLKDGNQQVWPVLTGPDEDDFGLYPLQFGTSIVLSFDGAGTAYIVYR